MTATGTWPRTITLFTALGFSACTLGPIPNPLTIGGGPIHLDAHPKPGNSLIERNGQAVVLLLKEVIDARKDAPTKKVGDIRATVIDMASTELKLDQSVSSSVSAALIGQLEADGFRVVLDPSMPHDFEVETVQKDFRLDIVDQDELNITADITLRSKNKDILWAGSVTEQSKRFSGVYGDSRASIVSYFNRGLNNWTVKASTSIRDSLFKAYPQTLTASARKAPAILVLDGVKTVTEVKPQEGAAVAATLAPSAPAVITNLAPIATPTTTITPTKAPINAPSNKGVFSITTTPSKAKVYIDDVYYGVSPLTLELDPGVAVCRFQLGGHKTMTEKVSIRAGQTTELEVNFNK